MSIVGEQLGVLCAKIVGLLDDRSLLGARLVDEKIYFKGRKRAAQQHFIVLTEANVKEAV